ncbi:hypothetical protein [Symbiopectobacterium sp. RP]|uniref:hypothetical protein n=1 Tax=Symbiopectobacterium sp. RP TaxID=3248553 RepID=UPI003D27844C
MRQISLTTTIITSNGAGWRVEKNLKKPAPKQCGLFLRRRAGSADPGRQRRQPKAHGVFW